MDEETSRSIIKHALELGINFFDTAIVYQNGTSEVYVGRALRDFARREDVAVATKFLSRSPQEIADGMTEADQKIIVRVAELADKYRVTMTEIALAWLLTKVDAPVAGATKLHHVEGAVKAVDLTLTDEDRNYLEELYVPHPLVGVMAQNTKNADREGQAWAKHAPKE